MNSYNENHNRIQWSVNGWQAYKLRLWGRTHELAIWMPVNARMRTVIDLNESEIDLNECEHVSKTNQDRYASRWSWLYRRAIHVNHLDSNLVHKWKSEAYKPGQRRQEDNADTEAVQGKTEETS